MITSNVQEILLKNGFRKINKSPLEEDTSFIDNLLKNKKSLDSNDLTYENISNLSFENIEKYFENEEDKSLAKNLKLATMFSKDKNLSKALYDTVLGKPFSLGYNYLFNMYEDKSTYFNSPFNSADSSLSSLLDETISRRFETGEKKITDQIPQERLDQLLTSINSFNFVEALSTGYKDRYDSYYPDKNKPDYSFLYKDHYLQYQELMYKYKKYEDNDKMMLNKFR